jgi:signal transduction histidine kinase
MGVTVTDSPRIYASGGVRSGMRVPTAGTELRLSGLALAVVGFAISRLTVAVSVSQMETLPVFVLTSVVPLVLSFALVIFGIGLTVSSLSRQYVRTVATWCVLGTGAMVLAVVVAAFETGTLVSMGGLFDETAGSFATDAVLGGAVGGTLIGVYAARTRQSNQKTRQQADRLHLLNRLLRDEILNSITVVQGRAEILDSEDANASAHAEPIQRNARHIQQVIDDVGALTADGLDDDRVLDSVDVCAVLEPTIDDLAARYPEAEIRFDDRDAAEVRADDQLSLLFEQLLDNAVAHNPAEAPTVDVAIETTDTAVTVTVSDDGPGLGEAERALLESGDLERYDRQSEGFGLWMVSILLDRYDGAAAVSVADGTTIRVSIPRADVRTSIASTSTGIGVSPETLRNAMAAGVVAGVGMGLTLQSFSNTLPVIGALYGTASVGVGWISHLFHSLVFAVVFATVLEYPRFSGVTRQVGLMTGLATGFGAVLWLVAAGVVMPLWLRLVGVEVPLPRLQFVPLVGHLLWGGLLGGSYWLLDHRHDG